MKVIKKIFNLRVTYFIVFSSLMFWAFFAYFTMNQLIGTQKAYAKIINITGKQRMLSQKTTLIAKRIFESKSSTLEEHFHILIETMKNDHQFILANLTTQEIKNIYFEEPYNLDQKVKKYFSLLNSFCLENNQKLLKEIEEYSFELLPILNHAVYAFEDDSNHNTSKLKKRELFILIGTLITLFLELIFIIMPTIRRVEDSKIELKLFNEKLEQKVQEQKDIILKEQVESVKKERTLMEQSKMASMGEMIGNIAHQWRQPLSVISTASTGMKMQKEFNTLKDEDFFKSCDVINENAQYLSKTIDDFRDFIKGKKEKEIFKIEDGITSFLHLVEGTIKKHNIQIVLDLRDNIEINSYKNELIQCLINIFNNAKDALRDKETKYIFLSASTQENNAVITIKDNGGGIPEDILPRIFEPYFTTKHQSQGTGLGLHMTYNLIVDGMHGTIEASNVNYEYEKKHYTGAEFTITLPLS